MIKKFELTTFYFSIIILLSWCIVPGIFQLTNDDIIFFHSIYEKSLFPESLIYAILLVISYVITFFIYYQFNKQNYIKKLYINNLRNNEDKIYLSFLLPIYLFTIYLQIINYRLEDIISSDTRYISEFPILNIISYTLLIFVYVKLSFIKKYNFYSKSFKIAVFLNLLIYPIATASRMILIPFLINIIFILIRNKHRIFLIPNVIFAIIAYSSSLITRNNLGLLNFLNNSFDSFLVLYNFLTFKEVTSVGVIPIDVLLGTLTLGITSISKALDIFSNQETYNIFLFLISFSPLPSFFLPASHSTINFNSPLNLGAARSATGINTDIASEWIFFFGHFGWFFGGLTFALLVITPIELIKRGLLKSIFNRICFQISIIYFFGAGYVMSIRAASRYFWYVLLLTLGWNFIKTNKIKKFNKFRNLPIK